MKGKERSPTKPRTSLLGKLGIVAAGGIGAALAIAIAAFPLSNILIKPRLKRLFQLRSPRLQRFLKRQGWDFQSISFRSRDGKRLHGWMLLNDPLRPTIILLHGVKGNRTSMIRFALTLCQANFNVLVFDGRAHGESEGEFVTYGYHEREDVQAALEFLELEYNLDLDRIGLLGLSMGAAIALQVAALNKRIRAVWADSPFASLRRVSTDVIQRATRMPEIVIGPFARATFALAGYRAKFNPAMVDPITSAKHVLCPVTLVHGTEDELISHSHSKMIYELLGSERKELWIIEGATHTTCIRRGGVAYRDRLVNFFNSSFESHI